MKLRKILWVITLLCFSFHTFAPTLVFADDDTFQNLNIVDQMFVVQSAKQGATEFANHFPTYFNDEIADVKQNPNTVKAQKAIQQAFIFGQKHDKAVLNQMYQSISNATTTCSDYTKCTKGTQQACIVLFSATGILWVLGFFSDSVSDIPADILGTISANLCFNCIKKWTKAGLELGDYTIHHPKKAWDYAIDQCVEGYFDWYAAAAKKGGNAMKSREYSVAVNGAKDSIKLPCIAKFLIDYYGPYDEKEFNYWMPIILSDTQKAVYTTWQDAKAEFNKESPVLKAKTKAALEAAMEQARQDAEEAVAASKKETTAFTKSETPIIKADTIADLRKATTEARKERAQLSHQ